MKSCALFPEKRVAVLNGELPAQVNSALEVGSRVSLVSEVMIKPSPDLFKTMWREESWRNEDQLPAFPLGLVRCKTSKSKVPDWRWSRRELMVLKSNG